MTINDEGYIVSSPATADLKTEVLQVMKKHSNRPDKRHKIMSQDTVVLALLASRPEYHFMTREIQQETKIPQGSINKVLQRMITAKKAIKRIAPGYWQYDRTRAILPEFKPNENDDGGELRIENLVAYTHQKEGLRGVYLSQEKGEWILSTGHMVRWERLSPDTMQISFTANLLHRPWTMDMLLTVFDILERDGLILEGCEVSRIEGNRDYGYRVIEGAGLGLCATLEMAKGEFLKVYNHGEYMRTEYASRINTPLTEVLAWMTKAAEESAMDKLFKTMREYGKRMDTLEYRLRHKL